MCEAALEVGQRDDQRARVDRRQQHPEAGAGERPPLVVVVVGGDAGPAEAPTVGVRDVRRSLSHPYVHVRISLSREDPSLQAPTDGTRPPRGIRRRAPGKGRAPRRTPAGRAPMAPGRGRPSTGPPPASTTTVRRSRIAAIDRRSGPNRSDARDGRDASESSRRGRARAHGTRSVRRPRRRVGQRVACPPGRGCCGRSETSGPLLLWPASRPVAAARSRC